MNARHWKRASGAAGGAALVAISVAIAFLGSAGSGCDATLNLGSGEASAATTTYTCEGTCTRIVDTCKLVAEDQRATCLAQCTSYGQPSDLECVAHTSCFAITARCARGTAFGSGDASIPALDTYEIAICQNGCDIAFGDRCLSASEQAECRDLCASVSSARRNSYGACAQGASADCSRQQECLAQMAGD